MKRLFVVATMFAALSLPALAAKNSQTVSIPSPVKAGSTQLTPGDYDVTWTGTGCRRSSHRHAKQKGDHHVPGKAGPRDQQERGSGNRQPKWDRRPARNPHAQLDVDRRNCAILRTIKR